MRSPKTFLKHEGGIALLEFALVLPILFVLLFGSIEVIRLLYIQQKVEKAGYVIADVVTRYTPADVSATAGEISVTEMNNNVFPILGRLMAEYKDPAMQAVIVTSVIRESGINKIKWQIASSADTLSGCSPPTVCVRSAVNNLAPGAISGAVYNTVASFATADADTQTAVNGMAEGENLIVSEVFFHYTPMLQSILQNVTTVFGVPFYLSDRYYVKRTYFAPRKGNLVFLPPTFPVF